MKKVSMYKVKTQKAKPAVKVSFYKVKTKKKS